MNLLGTAWRRLVLFALVLAAGGTLAQGSPASRTLRFIGNDDLAPIVSSDQGRARGVAVDLVLAAARAGGLDLRVEAMDWPQAQAEMAAGHADGLLHINPTPERLQTLAFSVPLLESHFHIYRRHDRVDIQDLASLAGRRVGVEPAGFPAQYLSKHPEVQVERVPSWRVAFERLSRGELDAVFVDQWAGDFALAQIAGADIVAVEPAVVEDWSRVAVAKGNTEVLAAIDRGLTEIKGNGTRQDILQRWSGQRVMHLTLQTVERSLVVAGAAMALVCLALTLAYALHLRRLNRALAGARDLQTQALRDAEQANLRLRDLMVEQTAIVDSDIVGIVKVRERTIVWSNQAFARMFGYAPDEVVGRSTRMMFVCEQDFEDFGALLSRTLETSDRFRGDLPQLRKDGSHGWFSYSVARLGQDSGVLLGAVVDVTTERAASAAQQQAVAELSALYNDSPIGLHSLASDGTILRINDTELKWLGRAREEVIGRLTYADLLDPASKAIFHECFPRFKRTGAADDLHVVLTASDGRALPVLVSARAVYDDAGRFVMSRSTVLNLTPQQRAQEQLEQAQRIARLGSWEINLLTGEIAWSREMRRLFDKSDHAALSVAEVLSTVHPDDRAWVLARYQRSCELGEPMQVRCRLQLADGEVRHVEMTGECRRNAGGTIVGMVGMAQDISTEVRSAQQLELSEQRFRAVVESQSELICRFRADGTVLLVNEQCCKTFGTAAEELVGTVWQPRVHADDLPRVEAGLAGLSPLNPIVVIENRVFTATQGERWMEFINQGFFDEAGRLVELQAVGRDITDRKHLEEQLAQALKVRQAMLDNDLVGIMTARDRLIVWANPAFEKMMGYRPAELVSRPTRLGYPSDSAHESFGKQAAAMFARGQRIALRAQYVRKDGCHIWCDVSGAMLDDAGLTLWVFVDVTARKLAEDELQRHRQNLEALVAERTAELTAAVELAQAANRAKSAFLATMSHELRTPMNAILGLTPIVKKRITDPKSQDYLAKVETAGRQLMALIDDVLDTTRIEANRLAINHVPLRLADILTRVDLALGAKAAQRGLTLQIESPPALLTYEFGGDPLRIEQIIANLVGNAIKFTAQGSVRICLSASPAPDGRTLLHVEVIDTGIGISADDQSRIFSLFEQVDTSMTRSYGGAGLGLALCKRLAALMHGRIGVTSTLGQGSCFWFELPLGDAQPGAARAPQVDDAQDGLRTRHAGVQVLVVEDDSVNAEVTRLMLEDVNLTMDWAPDGNAAVERVAARRYALILMDLQMPGMDGLAAARALASLPNGKDTPILALTARVLDLDQAACQDAGILGVIAKPVITSVFYGSLLTVLDGRRLAGAPGRQAMDPPVN